MCGYLYKMGKKSKILKKRWYELRNLFLFYFDKKGCFIPKGNFLVILINKLEKE